MCPAVCDSPSPWHRHLYWAAFDGVVSEHNGVGTTTTYLLHEVAGLKGRLRDRGLDLRVTVIGVDFAHDSVLYRGSSEARHRSDELLVAGATLPPRFSPYRSHDEWLELGSELLDLLPERAACPSLVVLNDVHFLSAAGGLMRRGYTVVAIPHSLASDWSLSAGEGRSAWERTQLASAVGEGALIGALSPHMRSRLGALGIAASAIIDSPLGVSPSALQDILRRREGLVAALGPRVRDVLSGPFGMWYGRATLDKGLDQAVRLFAKIHQRTGMRSLVFASEFGSEADSGAVASAVGDVDPEAVTVVSDHPFEAPRALLDHEGLRLLAVVPRREPVGLIPSELFLARAAHRPRTVVVYSSVDGLACQRALQQHGLALADMRSGDHVDLICSELEKANGEETGDDARVLVAADFDIGRNVRALLGLV